MALVYFQMAGLARVLYDPLLFTSLTRDRVSSGASKAHPQTDAKKKLVWKYGGGRGLAMTEAKLIVLQLRKERP